MNCENDSKTSENTGHPPTNLEKDKEKRKMWEEIDIQDYVSSFLKRKKEPKTAEEEYQTTIEQHEIEKRNSDEEQEQEPLKQEDKNNNNPREEVEEDRSLHMNSKKSTTSDTRVTHSKKESMKYHNRLKEGVNPEKEKQINSYNERVQKSIKDHYEKINILREKAYIEESKKYQDRPNVNKKSLEIAASNKTFWQRWEEKQRNNHEEKPMTLKSRLDQEKKLQAEKEWWLIQMQTKKKMTPEQWTEKLQKMKEIDQRKKEKFAQYIDNIKSNQWQECTFSPDINKVSKVIVKKKIHARSGSAVNRLYNEDAQIRKEKLEMLETKYLPTFKPNLSNSLRKKYANVKSKLMDPIKAHSSLTGTKIGFNNNNYNYNYNNKTNNNVTSKKWVQKPNFETNNNINAVNDSTDKCYQLEQTDQNNKSQRSDKPEQLHNQEISNQHEKTDQQDKTEHTDQQDQTDQSNKPDKGEQQQEQQEQQEQHDISSERLN